MINHQIKPKISWSGEREVLTMASEEPSTNHFVMSPFWMTRELEEDNGKRTTPFPLAESIENLRRRGRPALCIRLCLGNCETRFAAGFRNRNPLPIMLVIGLFICCTHSKLVVHTHTLENKLESAKISLFVLPLTYITTKI